MSKKDRGMEVIFSDEVREWRLLAMPYADDLLFGELEEDMRVKE